jgi:peptidoglycan/xylan/chitin deacetylase (PgdA/CDA1 family)
MKGIFTISLDFELHWGGFEKWPLEATNYQLPTANNQQRSYNTYFLNTRQVIPQLLKLFEQYEIHVTWATVGMLMARSKTELLEQGASRQPTYEEKQLSAYHYIQQVGIGEDEATDPFHFAPSLVEQIIKTPYQELGTHTYAHYYCNETGQTLEQFRSDIQAAQRVAQKFGVRLKSMVFPRNQFNDQYLHVCFEEGITSVRSNPLDWFWKIDSTQQESKWKRLNRGLDAYLPVGKENTFRLETLTPRKSYPLAIPASRLLRPYKPKELFLNRWKITRIKAEITRAAKRGEVYHLWWHPHNFGRYPAQSLQALREILEHYRLCKARWNMQSLNMGELAERVSK